MVTSLFSIFDPCSCSWSTPFWFMLSFMMIMVESSYWYLSSTLFILYSILSKMMNNKKSYNSLFLVTTSYMVLMLNMQNLFPLSFSFLSHLTFSLCITLPAWWKIVQNKLMMSPIVVSSHFLPHSTPLAMIFLVIPIEFIGFLLRPLTLGLRLTMNTMIGHILMSVLMNSNIMLFIPLFFFYEGAVMVIQAWIIMLLLTNYLEEYEGH
uniref:ATP synthase F0 subunit 6 n=1 Tax=Laemobothrion maximum TaxID=2337902 RepID=UPI00257DCA8F|nr:ATP synthase F0 subunit 6 [Laemobothrion maximum]WGU50338.1 ATP synthase subunit 6 [Laemobothrion maximum]